MIKVAELTLLVSCSTVSLVVVMASLPCLVACSAFLVDSAA